MNAELGTDGSVNVDTPQGSVNVDPNTGITISNE